MNSPPKLPAIERRYTPGTVELRTAEGDDSGARSITGYGAKFSTRSNDMGWAETHFFEIIEPGFFDNVLGDDVRGLFNHDSNYILGRTASKTMRIGQDATGLHYDCDADPKISYVADLLRSLERGDVNQSSFAFTVGREGSRWVEEGDTITRYLTKGGCTGLYDVSPVTYPAYNDATSEARSLVARAQLEGHLGHDAAEALERALVAATAQRRRQLDLLELS